LRDLRLTEKITQVKWLLKFVTERRDTAWKALTEYYLRNCAGDWGLFGKETLMCRIPPNNYSCPPFWRAALTAWESLPWSLSLEGLSPFQARNFPLWCNRWITSVGSKVPLSDERAKICAAKGVIRVKDVNLVEIGEDPEWWRVVTGIPDVLQEHARASEDDDEDEDEEDTEQSVCDNLVLQGTPIGKIKNKHLLNAFRTQGFPKALIKWEERGIRLNWKKTWRGIWKSGAPHKWNDLVFLALHHGLWTGERAKRLNWKKISWECKECGVLETVTHLFWECVRSREIRKELGDGWRTIQEYLSDGGWKQRMAFWATWKGRCDDGREERGYCRNRMKGELEKLKLEHTKA